MWKGGVLGSADEQPRGASCEEFTRLFRKSTTTTPLSTYNRLLIDRANDLLQAGANSVKEVTATLHFDSVSHFSSLYKKLTGHSPSTVQSACA
jgi:AraC family transcriptional regulator